jgi:hypothetical protein
VEGHHVGSVVDSIQRSGFQLRFQLLPYSFVSDEDLTDDYDILNKFRGWCENAGRLERPFFFAWNPNDPSSPGSAGTFDDETIWAVVDPKSTLRTPLRSAIGDGYRDVRINMIALADPGTGLKNSITNVNFP